MGLMDDAKNALGSAVKGAAENDQVKEQVKTTVTDAVGKIAGDKVDKSTVSGAVGTAVDEAAKFAQQKLGGNQ